LNDACCVSFADVNMNKIAIKLDIARFAKHVTKESIIE